MAAIQALFDHFSSSLSAAAENPNEVLHFNGFLSMFAMALYTARELARLLRIILESALGKPKLIRETTRTTYIRALFHSLITSFKKEKSYDDYNEKFFDGNNE